MKKIIVTSDYEAKQSDLILDIQSDVSITLNSNNNESVLTLYNNSGVDITVYAREGDTIDGEDTYTLIDGAQIVLNLDGFTWNITSNDNDVVTSIKEFRNIETIEHVENVFTIDLDNKYTVFKNLTSADATAKSLVLTNVPDGSDKYITLDLKVNMTTACVLTYPTGSIFPLDDAPTYADGDVYLIECVSFDAGTSWILYPRKAMAAS